MNDDMNEGRQDGDEPVATMRWTYPDETRIAQIQDAREMLGRALEVLRVDARRARSTDRTDDHLAAQNAWSATVAMYETMRSAFLDAEIGGHERPF